MSFLRAYLRLSLTRLTEQSKFITFAFTLGLLASVALLAQSGWSSLAAKRSSADSKMSVAGKPDVAATKGRTNTSSTRQNDQQQPEQGCTVNCNATVPATGAANSAISFAATATTNGCPTQPTFEWTFGDGSQRSNQQNTTHQYSAAGTYSWSLTTSVSTGSTMIDTIAGGLGEGNLATQSPFGVLVAAARDPQNRGLYVVDIIGGNTLIRFINTTTTAVTIAGKTIAPGTVRTVAGGGTELGVGILGTRADLGTVAGLDVSADGNLLYFSAPIDREVRVLNVSASTITVAGTSVASGNIGLVASGFGEGLSGIVVHNTTGEIYAADATPGVNKVFKISTAGAVTPFAGNGATTKDSDSFQGGQALNIPLLQPRGVELDSSNRIVIADTGHGRIIRVETNGAANLVNQFTIADGEPNPYPVGLCVQGANIFVVLGNQQTIVRLSGGAPVTVAGQTSQSCDYSVSSCGDGGAATSALFGFPGSTGNPPLVGITCDNTGIFILDQALTGRGRIRFLNTSGSAATVAGVTIAPNSVDRIGGNGLATPYDGGLATSATFNTPTGVAVDANGNLWIADQISARIRFVNRGASSVKIFAGTVSEQTVPGGGIVTVNKNVGSGANDGVPVIQAGFNYPQGLFITSQGIYVADSLGGPNVPMQASGRRTSTLRFINTSASNVTIYPGSATPISVPAGQVAKIAGGGESTSSNGDGGFALSAKFIGMSDVVVDSNGNIFVTDTGQNAVRRINGASGQTSSILTTKQYTGLGIGADNRLYVANYTDGTVLRENTAGGGTFSTFASGFNKPRDVAVAADGTAYVTVGPAPTVTANNQIVQISAAGTPTVIAGSTAGFSGDGGPAASAQINISPSSLVVGSTTANQLPETVNIVVTAAGDIIFADSNNNRIRRISASTVTCSKSGTITIQGDNPVPTLSLLNPNNALAGGGSLTLSVEGTSFVPTSKVRWNGQDRTTTFVSNTQLTASIPATDLTTAGTASVTVVNPAPGGGSSNALTFTVNAPNPLPDIVSLTPNSAVENSAAFTLTVNGTGFVSGSVVRWDGQARVTEYVSPVQLRAQILASDLVGVGQASVTVFNPLPGGGGSSIALFTITAGQNPVPTLISIGPNTAIAGGPAFTLTAIGTNFVASSKIRWSGQDLATVFVNSTQLTALVTANLIATGGTVPVTVFTSPPGGGVTTAQTFTITGGVPAVATVSAASFLGNQLAPESIVAAFGSNLATGIAVASTIPLPTTLLGTKVSVKDSAGTSRDAALFFVAPTQVNYQIPPGTAAGSAMVSVVLNGNAVAAGTITVATVAPGLFSANSSGQGVAAAVVLRIRNGVQTFEPVSQLGAGGQVPIDIDMGPAGDLVYVLFYGTGLRFRTAPGNISVNLGVQPARALNPANFEDAFAVAGFVGLDQANVLLPRTLIGAGLINVSLTVDGKPSNTIQLRIK